MVTKEQAVNARYRQEFYTKGQNGKVYKVRVSGKCQTWKTRPEEFRLPVKYGLHESRAITDTNASSYFDNVECK